jgi:hypothetical protein
MTVRVNSLPAEPLACAERRALSLDLSPYVTVVVTTASWMASCTYARPDDPHIPFVVEATCRPSAP